LEIAYFEESEAYGLMYVRQCKIEIGI